MTKTVSSYEARTKFGELVNLAYYQGAEIIVERMGKPMVKITRVDAPSEDREFDPNEVMKQIDAFAGKGGSAQGIDMPKVFKAMKENYDVERLLGR